MRETSNDYYHRLYPPRDAASGELGADVDAIDKGVIDDFVREPPSDSRPDITAQARLDANSESPDDVLEPTSGPEGLDPNAAAETAASQQEGSFSWAAELASFVKPPQPESREVEAVEKSSEPMDQAPGDSGRELRKVSDVGLELPGQTTEDSSSVVTEGLMEDIQGWFDSVSPPHRPGWADGVTMGVALVASDVIAQKYASPQDTSVTRQELSEQQAETPAEARFKEAMAHPERIQQMVMEVVPEPGNAWYELSNADPKAFREGLPDFDPKAKNFDKEFFGKMYLTNDTPLLTAGDQEAQPNKDSPSSDEWAETTPVELLSEREQYLHAACPNASPDSGLGWGLRKWAARQLDGEQKQIIDAGRRSINWRMGSDIHQANRALSGVKYMLENQDKLLAHKLRLAREREGNALPEGRPPTQGSIGRWEKYMALRYQTYLELGKHQQADKALIDDFRRVVSLKDARRNWAARQDDKAGWKVGNRLVGSEAEKDRLKDHAMLAALQVQYALHPDYEESDGTPSIQNILTNFIQGHISDKVAAHLAEKPSEIWSGVVPASVRAESFDATLQAAHAAWKIVGGKSPNDASRLLHEQVQVLREMVLGMQKAEALDAGSTGNSGGLAFSDQQLRTMTQDELEHYKRNTGEEISHDNSQGVVKPTSLEHYSKLEQQSARVANDDGTMAQQRERLLRQLAKEAEGNEPRILNVLGGVAPDSTRPGPITAVLASKGTQNTVISEHNHNHPKWNSPEPDDALIDSIAFAPDGSWKTFDLTIYEGKIPGTYRSAPPQFFARLKPGGVCAMEVGLNAPLARQLVGMVENEASPYHGEFTVKAVQSSGLIFTVDDRGGRQILDDGRRGITLLIFRHEADAPGTNRVLQALGGE